VPLISRRDPTGPRGSQTPIISALDRPEMQPVLRPLSSLRQSAPPGALGHYAPPRSADREAFQAPPRRRVQLLAVGVSAAIVLGVLGVVLARRGGSARERPAPRPAPVAVVPPASPSPAASPVPAPTGPCGAGMVLVDGDRLDSARTRFCVDRHEWPGPGEAPRVGDSLDEAATKCRRRGARLCEPAEWEAACRGPGRSSFPYGARYVDKRCNARGGAISATGSFPECQSAAGAFDMSGNAAEWDAEGGVRGASATDGTRGRCSELRRRGIPRERARDRADIGFRCCDDPLAKVTPSR